jgi:hypothetical protein
MRSSIHFMAQNSSCFGYTWSNKFIFAQIRQLPPAVGQNHHRLRDASCGRLKLLIEPELTRRDLMDRALPDAKVLTDFG